MRNKKTWLDSRKQQAKTVKPIFAVTDLGDGEAEIILYGDVLENDPVDWMTGEKSTGLYITAESFMREMENIRSAEHITIHLNSSGGDLYTGVSIHNLLRQLKGRKTIIIDGLAASAASVIACAADELLVMPGSIMMVHEGYVPLCGWYTRSELSQIDTQFEASVKSMLRIYASKANTDESVIEEMVKSETWLVGQEIIDAGFADGYATEEDQQGDDSEVDEVIYDEDNQTLTVAGIEHEASMYRNIPFAKGRSRLQAAPLLRPAAAAINHQTPPMAAETEGVAPMELKDLRAQYPDLIAQAERQAEMQERERIKGIEEIASMVPASMVNDAKFENPCTAEELSYKAMKAQSQRGKTFLAEMQEDSKESGTDEVKPDPKDAGDDAQDVKQTEEDQQGDDEEAKETIKEATAYVNSLKRKVR